MVGHRASSALTASSSSATAGIATAVAKQATLKGDGDG